MENFDIKFLSQRIKENKRNLYENIKYEPEGELSPDKLKKMKKSKEEKFVQLLDDSDSLEEISPELCKKLEEEKEQQLSFSNNIKIFIEKGGIKKMNSLKLRNSSINLAVPKYKKSIFSEKDKKSNDNLDEKKTYTNRKNILLYDSKTIEEEDQKDEEDNNSADENSKVGNPENKLTKIIIFEESLDNSNHSNLKMQKSKSKDFTSSSGRKSKLLDEIKNMATKINVYIFGSEKSITINIYPSNTVKEIKAKIINELKAKKYNLTNTSTDAYDLRTIDEEGDSPDMDFPPLRDYIKVAGLGPQALAFLKNPDKSISREKSFDMSALLYQKKQNLRLDSFKRRNSQFSVVPEEDDEEGPEKYEVKIYYKDIKEEEVIKSENIFLNPEDCLRNILEHFFKKNLLKIKNVNLYYFVTHNNEEDLENPYSLDINIKYLPPPYELDLCYKIFPDVPHALNTYHISVNRKRIEERIKQL